MVINKMHGFFLCCILVLHFCTSSLPEVKKNIYGGTCKIWLIYDSGYLPIILCFDEVSYQDYRLKNDGSLSIREQFAYGNSIFQGGTWRINSDRLILNDFYAPKQSLLSDTIYLDTKKYLLNITDKFNVYECGNDRLRARFKGGDVDSISWILNYKVAY